MTTPTDALMLLQRADPVDSGALPTGDSEQARALADRIVGRRNRRPAFVLVLLAVLAAVVIATPALGGARQRIVQLFASANPAPTRVVEDFAELDVGAPSGMAPGVIAGEAREVMEVRLTTGKTAVLGSHRPAPEDSVATFRPQAGEERAGVVATAIAPFLSVRAS